MAKDDDLLPKKKTSTTSKTSKKTSGPSGPMRRLMRIVRGVGILFGGTVTLVGMMSVVGIVTDNVWVRLLVAAVVVFGLPAFVSDRFLKRTNLGGGLGMVGDIFAIVFLGTALALVAADMVSKPLFVREGDRYARSGSRVMARVAYFFGGVTPVFPEDHGAPPAGSTSASASAPPAGSGK